MRVPPELISGTIWLALALGSLVAWFILRRRRRASDHPHCQKCDFDLFGLPETSHNCPECGTDIRAPHARPSTVAVLSKWRWLHLVSALICLALAGVDGWRYATNRAYFWNQPTIFHAVRYAQGDRDAVMRLLARRIHTDGIGTVSARLIGRSTPIPAEPVDLLSDEFAAVVLARALGYVDDEQWGSFVERCNPIACTATYLDGRGSLRVRTAFDTSSEIAFIHYISPPAFGDRLLEVQIASVMVNGDPLGKPLRSSNLGRAARAAWADIPPSIMDTPTLTVRLQITLAIPNLPHVTHTWLVDVPTPLRIDKIDP